MYEFIIFCMQNMLNWYLERDKHGERSLQIFEQFKHLVCVHLCLCVCAQRVRKPGQLPNEDKSVRRPCGRCGPDYCSFCRDVARLHAKTSPSPLLLLQDPDTMPSSPLAPSISFLPLHFTDTHFLRDLKFGLLFPSAIFSVCLSSPTFKLIARSFIPFPDSLF